MTRLREAEDVAVDELPARLVLADLVVLDVHVAREVVLEQPHENDRQERRQQQHEHERVDDAQPVDLERARQEARVVVAAHSVEVLEV